MSGGRVLDAPTWDELGMTDWCPTAGCRRLICGSYDLHAFPADGSWFVRLLHSDTSGWLALLTESGQPKRMTEDEALAACAYLLSRPATEEQEGEEG